MPKKFEPPRSIAESLSSSDEPKRSFTDHERSPRKSSRKPNRKIISFTLEEKHIKAIKEKAYEMSSPDKSVSASQALTEILEEFFTGSVY